MAYGAAIMAGFTVLRGQTFGFDPSFAYTASLLYLAVFATVIAFWSHLTLLGRIGADRASYAAVLFPVIALGLSTAFEEFMWTASAGLGVAMVIAGNGLVLARASRRVRPGA
jgi:drug/metabolite transporter (DMT)-like permease